MAVFDLMFVLSITVVCGRIPVPGVDEVNAAIANIDLHYSDALCLELLLVDCANHFTPGDEMICGSDGVTYDNHCRFTHAVCEYKNNFDHQLTLNSHGPCPVTPSTVSFTTKQYALPWTTTDPINAIIQNVFCQQVDTIFCSHNYSVVCGSDGLMYPNECELSKQKCHDPTLTRMPDLSFCSS